MNIKRFISTYLYTTLLCLVCSFSSLSCKKNDKIQPLPAIPEAPDYADSTGWFVAFHDAPVDIFYIVSTETGDYTLNGIDYHHADTYNDSIRQFLTGEMVGVEQILCGNFNFYSPYYRQCTLQTFTSDSLVKCRIPLAMGDIRKAFAHYLALYNQGRPFILAGFSQGGIAVLELLKQLDSATFSRMVAAYIIGWKVTDADLAQTHCIIPAKDSADLGVTICYNSVRDNTCAIPMLSDGNRIAINPVNWRTDATPAILHDSITVTLSPEYHVLVVSGYDGAEYKPYRNFLNVGDIHSCEPWLYSESIQRNIAIRTSRFRRK